MRARCRLSYRLAVSSVRKRHARSVVFPTARISLLTTRTGTNVPLNLNPLANFTLQSSHKVPKVSEERHVFRLGQFGVHIENPFEGAMPHPLRTV